VREVLEQRGHTVLTARSGEDALTIADRHAGPIHLLVADVVMPGIGGRELAERLAARRLGLHVLFMSGYTDDTILTQEVLQARVAFLEKPFTPEELARKVSEVFTRASGSGAGTSRRQAPA
ncbi:MAG TPA: response regulator, partial [Polyangiaceae bacterium]